jgi:hypothetical protein
MRPMRRSPCGGVGRCAGTRLADAKRVATMARKDRIDMLVRGQCMSRHRRRLIRLRLSEGGMVGEAAALWGDTRNVTGHDEYKDRVSCRRNSPIAQTR